MYKPVDTTQYNTRNDDSEENSKKGSLLKLAWARLTDCTQNAASTGLFVFVKKYISLRKFIKKYLPVNVLVTCPYIPQTQDMFFNIFSSNQKYATLLGLGFVEFF